MTSITFTVPGVPVAKGRARSARTKSGKTIHYTPAKTASFESFVKVYARKAMNCKLRITEACRMEAVLFMPIPNSWSVKKKIKAMSGTLRPTTRPDSSNIIKAIEDALNHIVYVDDSQIVSHVIDKWYSHTPRSDITITTI